MFGSLARYTLTTHSVQQSACSVAVSYKPPMLVTRVRLPACAFASNCGGDQGNANPDNESRIFTTSGVAQWLACWAHNPKVRRSKPRFAISICVVYDLISSDNFLEASSAGVNRAGAWTGLQLLEHGDMQGFNSSSLALLLPHCPLRSGASSSPSPCSFINLSSGFFSGPLCVCMSLSVSGGMRHAVRMIA